jgi:hypothetical protein
MSDSRDSAETRRFSDAEVESLLKRAIEIDERVDPRVDLSQLRAIASEIGVRSDSLDTAMRELDRSLTDRSESTSTISIPWSPALAGAAIGIVLTGLGAWPISARSYDMFIPFTSLVLGSVILAAFRSGTRPLAQFQMRNAGLWLGFLATQILILVPAAGTSNSPAMVNAIVNSCVWGWMSGTGLGSTVIWLAARSERSGGQAPGHGEHVPLTTRIRTSLKRCIDTVHRSGVAPDDAIAPQH